MSILTLKNVSYSYKTKYRMVQALKGVSCSFEQGKVYAIIGKSGSGKTTMLSLVAGLDLPSDGEVLYKNTTTRKIDKDKYRRENVAVIYQSYNLFPLLTVLENVMYPLELNGVNAKEAQIRAAEKIISVGLNKEMFKQYPVMLSGGEQQRVAIARALAAGSKVILADEPTGNLDTENGENVIRILKDLAHINNCCVIIVTHDLAIAGQADVVMRMKDGELSLTENPSEAI